MAVCVQNKGKEFARAVSPSLKHGVSALNALCISLLGIDKSFVAKSESAFGEIRSAVLSAMQNLENAQTTADRELKAVDKCYEELLVTKTNLSRQQADTNNKLKDLKSQQSNNKATLEMYKESASNAMCRLRDARDDLSRQRRAVQEAEEIRKAGIGISFIPFVGWIAGPLMIASADTDIANANYRVEQAERTVRSFESSVNEFSWKVSDYTNRIQATCNEIAMTQDKLREIDWHIEEVVKQRTDIADFQGKMRTSVNVLGCLAGASHAAEVQTRCLVLLKIMVEFMQNFVKLLDSFQEDRLISDDGIKALSTDLKVNYVKMQAIKVHSNTAGIEDYL